MRNESAHQLYKFGTNWIANSKMADKMAAVQVYGCNSGVYISFQAVMQASMLGFLVTN